MVRNWHPIVTRPSWSLLFALIVASISYAYPTPVDFGGNILRWNIDINSPRVTYQVLTDQPENLPMYTNMVSETANIWSSVVTSYLKLEPARSDEAAQITLNFNETIQGGESAAGYAEFDEEAESGPLHCSIYIAADSAMDWESLAKTTLHEMGHCIGLGHSLVGASIMSYQLDKNSFALALDDKAVVSRLYPKDASKPKLPPGCVLQSTKDSGHSLRWFELVILVLLPMVLPIYRRFATHNTSIF